MSTFQVKTNKPSKTGVHMLVAAFAMRSLRDDGDDNRPLLEQFKEAVIADLEQMELVTTEEANA